MSREVVSAVSIDKFMYCLYNFIDESCQQGEYLMDAMKEIGEKIASKRKEKGLTQKELADILHVSDKNVSKCECGRGVPDIFYMKILADVFGVSVDYFVQGEVKGIKDLNSAKRTRAGKISFTLLLISALVPLLVTVFARMFLPSTVPCHYDVHGAVTRWGSSKELISMGASYFGIIFIAAIAVYFIFSSTKNAEVRQWTVWLTFGCFFAMAVAMTGIETGIILRDYRLSSEAGYVAGDYSRFNQLFSAIICAVYAIFGALCVFVPQNPLLGVRIPYAFKGKSEWAFVNAFAGMSMYLSSVIMLIVVGVADYPSSMALTVSALFVPIVATLIAVFVSVVLHKRIKAKEEKCD